MNVYDIYDMFLDSVPFQRKTSGAWIVPAAIGVGIGAAIGVGMGMILAPSAGYETRQKLRDGATQIKQRAMTAATRAKDQFAAKANGVSEQLGYDVSHDIR